MSIRETVRAIEARARDLGIALSMSKLRDAIALALVDRHYSAAVAAETAGKLPAVVLPPPHLARACEVYGLESVRFAAAFVPRPAASAAADDSAAESENGDGLTIKINDLLTGRAPLSNASIPEELAGHLREYLMKSVCRGFGSKSSVLKDAVDRIVEEWPFDDLGPPPFRAEKGLVTALRRHGKEIIEELLAEQSSWPEVTDNDRLNIAMRALRRQGIVACQDFVCCTTCASDALFDELDRRQWDARPPHGFVFYHAQDTDLVIEGDGDLFLKFGCASAEPEDKEAVAEQIILALNAAGLSPSWDGDVKKCIRLPISWRRRLAPRTPLEARFA